MSAGGTCCTVFMVIFCCPCSCIPCCMVRTVANHQHPPLTPLHRGAATKSIRFQSTAPRRPPAHPMQRHSLGPHRHSLACTLHQGYTHPLGPHPACSPHPLGPHPACRPLPRAPRQGCTRHPQWPPLRRSRHPRWPPLPWPWARSSLQAHRRHLAARWLATRLSISYQLLCTLCLSGLELVWMVVDTPGTCNEAVVALWTFDSSSY